MGRLQIPDAETAQRADAKNVGPERRCLRPDRARVRSAHIGSLGAFADALCGPHRGVARCARRRYASSIGGAGKRTRCRARCLCPDTATRKGRRDPSHAQDNGAALSHRPAYSSAMRPATATAPSPSARSSQPMKILPLRLGQAKRALKLEEPSALVAVAVVVPKIENAAARAATLIVENEPRDGLRSIDDVARCRHDGPYRHGGLRLGVCGDWNAAGCGGVGPALHGAKAGIGRRVGCAVLSVLAMARFRISAVNDHREHLFAG